MFRNDNEKWASYGKRMCYYKLLDSKKKVMDKKQILSWEDNIKQKHPDWDDMETDYIKAILANPPLLTYSKNNPAPTHKVTILQPKKKPLDDIENLTDEEFCKNICDLIKEKGDPIKVNYNNEDCFKMMEDEKKHYPNEKYSISRNSILNDMEKIEKNIYDEGSLKEQLIDFVLPRLIIYRLERGAENPLPDYLNDINHTTQFSLETCLNK